MIHAKMIKVDDKIIFLGSSNLTKLSMRALGEFNVLIYDNYDFIKRINVNVLKNIKDSIKIDDPDKIKFSKIRAMAESFLN